MLEWDRDKSGSPIPKWDGTLLASKVDATREADQWTKHVEPILNGVQFVFVLGLGGGYHVHRLAESNPSVKVIAIDFIEDLAENYRRSFSFRENIQIVVLKSPAEVFSNPILSEVFGDLYVVVRHSASARLWPDQYNEVERHLLGRDPQSFYMQLQHRPDDLEFFKQLAFETVRKKGLTEVNRINPISIKTILDSMEKKSMPLTERAMIWKALGELLQ